MTLRLRTAEELRDPRLEARWAARRRARRGPVIQAVLRAFAATGGPVTVEAIQASLPGRPRRSLREALATLDAQDLLRLEADRVVLAYPFSARPTAYAVTLPDGARRYAVCAVDALGIAPMLGVRTGIESRCHHCGEALAFSVDPAGPGSGSAGVVLWIGRLAASAGRLAGSL